MIGPAELARIKALVIPPAWEDVCVRPLPDGHIQAVGTDDASRLRARCEVAGYLGNTPAVARVSYIDPQVIELYADGVTIATALGGLGKGREFGDAATEGPAERAVLDLLAPLGSGGGLVVLAGAPSAAEPGHPAGRVAGDSHVR